MSGWDWIGRGVVGVSILCLLEATALFLMNKGLSKKIVLHYTYEIVLEVKAFLREKPPEYLLVQSRYNRATHLPGAFTGQGEPA
jgi:hypothetical protein